ncbi:hypothetical protein IKS57_01825 [bacterium]|nr:hypothetical protein [bacterium]
MSVQFFNKLKNTIQKTILEKCFSKIKNIELDTFKYLLFSFVSLRNKISHNEVIYNFKCEDNKNIFKICNKKDNRIKQKIKKKIEKDFSKLLNQKLGINLNILYLIKIIGLINNNKKLEEKILDKIKELKNSIYKGKKKDNETLQPSYYPCKEAWENICNFLGCKDNINKDNINIDDD